ncbi:MAG: putative toxin-antitoxin system toxin component, PIN family [Clostridia bacterium]|nr:putative toxin-antitoxin system toxin component, PIN family [Clostridia bacterium]
MNVRAIVLDTNVLVSALLTPLGTPARLLDAVLARRVRVLFDDRILAEYGEVLARERFGFDPDDVGALLDFLKSEGQAVVAPPQGVVLPDPDDVMFVEVALAGGADAIVTGNRSHFPDGMCRGIPVLSPAEFLGL